MNFSTPRMRWVAVAAWFALVLLYAGLILDKPDEPQVLADMGDNSANGRVLVGDFDGNGVKDWHDRYVFDHCKACPECCTNGTEPVEEEYSGLDRIAEQAFCTPDVCPGRCCPCVKGAKGLWWIDATYFGTDDDPECGVPVPVEP